MVKTGPVGSGSRGVVEQTLLDEVVTLQNMSGLRVHVLRLAERARLPTDRAEAFAVAVNEAVANAIEHGGGGGELVVVQDDQRRLAAEIRDSGPGMPRSITVALPPPDALRGRGMWLAGELADHVDVHADQRGTTVRLEMDLQAP